MSVNQKIKKMTEEEEMKKRVEEIYQLSLKDRTELTDEEQVWYQYNITVMEDPQSDYELMLAYVYNDYVNNHIAGLGSSNS